MQRPIVIHGIVPVGLALMALTGCLRIFTEVAERGRPSVGSALLALLPAMSFYAIWRHYRAPN